MVLDSVIGRRVSMPGTTWVWDSTLSAVNINSEQMCPLKIVVSGWSCAVSVKYTLDFKLLNQQQHKDTDGINNFYTDYWLKWGILGILGEIKYDIEINFTHFYL